MSVSLLHQLMDDTLDAGYAEAAARRAQARRDGTAPAGGRLGAHLLAAVALLLIGVVLGIGYRHTQRQAPQSDAARQALVTDVERETGVSDRLQRRAEDLSGQLSRARDSALTQSEAGEQAATTLRDLERGAALTAVHGPGIKVTLGDAQPVEKTDPVTGEPVVVPPDENGRVLDRDIQSVVNALWSAGAEAITIDGARMSATTPIRAAGDAILVDLLPVSSPYSIEAIGDPGSLPASFAETAAARRFATWSTTYGLRFSIELVDSLDMRPATGTDLHYAEPVPGTEPETAPQSGAPPSNATRPTQPTTGVPASPAPTSGGGR